MIQIGARETERLLLLHAQELAFPELTAALRTLRRADDREDDDLVRLVGGPCFGHHRCLSCWLTRTGSEAKSAARRDSDGPEAQPRFSSSALALLGPDPHQAAPVQGVILAAACSPEFAASSQNDDPSSWVAAGTEKWLCTISHFPSRFSNTIVMRTGSVIASPPARI